jgi:drug/metabolite transporter (DMT)-like permease
MRRTSSVRGVDAGAGEAAAADDLVAAAGAAGLVAAGLVAAGLVPAFFLGQKPLLRRYGSLELTTWAMALGALMALPLAPGLPAAVGSAPAEALLAVAFLGVGASAVGFDTWAYACARVDVSVAAATLYAVPVVAFSAGWLWLGERPAAMAVFGGAIALGGVALVARSGRAERRERPQAGRSPKPRRSSSALPPSVPGRGSTPRATAAP